MTPWHSLICSLREGSFLRSRRQIQHWDRISATEPTFPTNNLLKLTHTRTKKGTNATISGNHWNPVITAFPKQFVNPLTAYSNVREEVQLVGIVRLFIYYVISYGGGKGVFPIHYNITWGWGEFSSIYYNIT